MIKKIQVVIVEEKKKRTYRHTIDVKQGVIPQEDMAELADAILADLTAYGVLPQNEGSIWDTAEEKQKKGKKKRR